MKAKWQNTVIDINRSLILARGYLKCNGVTLVIFFLLFCLVILQECL